MNQSNTIQNTCKTLIYLQFYDGSIMFMGSFPFGGMLGSCRREGMCMLTMISAKGKLIMLIKQAMAYGNKSVTLKHFQKQVVRLARNISRDKQA